MSTKPLSLRRFTDTALEQRTDLYNRPESVERGIAFHDWGQVNTLTNLVQSKIQENQVDDGLRYSATKANAVFGIPGTLTFNKPVSPAVAGLRHQNAIEYQARKQILASDSVDNNWAQNISMFASGLGGTLLSPESLILDFAAPILGGAANTLRGLKTLSLVRNGTKTAAMLDAAVVGLDTARTSKTYAAGFSRATADVLFPQLLSEAAIKDFSENNGYDYNLASNMAFVAFGAAGAGLLGGHIAKLEQKSFGSTFDNFVKNADMAVRGPQAAKYEAAGTFTFVNNMIQDNVISPLTYDNMILKATSDMAEGRITDPSITKAITKIETSGKEVKTFLDDMAEGRYAFIDEEAAKNIPTDAIKQLKPRANFTSWIVDTIAPGLMKSFPSGFRPVLTAEFIQKYRPRIGSLGKVDGLIKDLETQLNRTNLDRNLLAKAEQEASKNLTSKKFFAEGPMPAKQEILSGQINTIENELTQARSAKLKIVADRADALYGSASKLDKLASMSFETFTANYKKLSQRIKDRKLDLKDMSGFFRLQDKTQEDIFRLTEMLNLKSPEELFNKDLLNATTDDLVNAHYGRKLESELSALSEDDALDILKKTYGNPTEKLDNTINEMAENFTQKVNEVIDLQADEAIYLKQLETSGDARVLDELKLLDQQSEKELNLVKARQQVFSCLAGE